MKQFTIVSYSAENFGQNQLLNSSMSLSPLYQSLHSDLHVNMWPNLHQTFAWLHSELV